MSSNTSGTVPHYFVPAPSRHPVTASFGLLIIIASAAEWINGADWAKYTLLIGFLWLFWVLFNWFGDAIHESETGQYGHKIEISYRWSMSWFIISEVMFFGAFFTALWWMRVHSVPALGGIDNALLWPDFKAVWPSIAPGATASPANIIEPFQTMTPFWLPTINTALLLSSGVTITIAHHLLREGKRGPTIMWMWITVLLGFTFVCVQGYEYFHAYHELNLKLTSGAYGSTFFMLTGFHGFHVMVGMLMLFFITLRLM